MLFLTPTSQYTHTVGSGNSLVPRLHSALGWRPGNEVRLGIGQRLEYTS